MSKLFIETIDRGDGKKLHLYSQNKAEYKTFSGLPPVQGNQTHLRFHPTRSEWVAYSTSRQNRTFLPNAMECPLCPMDSEEKASDIPVDQYEVAIFTNRFSSLRMEETHVPELEISTQSATGTCDVISYSSNHKDQFSELPKERIELILKAVAHRSKELFNNSQIEYVLPFENKGKEIGVTLEHPHGQIYSFGHIPETIIRQSENQIQNPLLETIAQIPKELILLENKSGVCFVPRWARYPFEIWVVPHLRVSQVYDLDDEEIKNISDLLLQSSKMLDKVFNEPMPYTLAWQLAPRGYQDSHHLHWCFQPIKRSKTKLKYLAGVEQITGFYLVDLPPERSARILRGEEQPDE